MRVVLEGDIMKEIDFSEYENLKLLLWDRSVKRLSPQDAFHFLDNRLAKYFSPDELSETERTLVQEFARQYGGGIIDGWEF